MHKLPFRRLYLQERGALFFVFALFFVVFVV